MTFWRPASWSTFVVGYLCAIGCEARLADREPLPTPTQPHAIEPATAPISAPTAAASSPPLSIMTWNVEWFQDPQEGPSDDALQLERVLEVLQRADCTLAALQEVSAPAGFDRLVADLSHHAGVLSKYRWTQKLGLLYDERRLRLLRATAIEGLDDAGRPPLDVRFELLPEGDELRVIVIHAKASSDPASHATRVRFANELARRLESRVEPMLVLGDFNDRLDRALAADEPSPYRALLDTGLLALTGSLPDRGKGGDGDGAEQSSWIGPIDHILVSPGLAERVVAGSVDVMQRELTAIYPDFERTVSDHFPVMAAIAP